MIALPPPSWPDGWLQPELGRGTMALMTAREALHPERHAGSRPPYDAFNLGLHVADEAATVMAHRQAVEAAMGAKAVWLEQVHGHRVVRLRGDTTCRQEAMRADGSYTTEAGVACTVMVADCLPVLLAAPAGRGVAALHAGWRGLAGAGAMAGRGVVDAGVAQLCAGAGCEPSELQAWLGPCIGPQAFEVGEEVLRGFGVDPAQAHPRFQPIPSSSKWLGDLAGLAADRLRALGLRHISGGAWCTVTDRSSFFSFR